MQCASCAICLNVFSEHLKLLMHKSCDRKWSGREFTLDVNSFYTVSGKKGAT